MDKRKSQLSDDLSFPKLAPLLFYTEADAYRSTFVQTQKGYNNGIYLALVLGSFGQFSPRASDLVDLVAQSRATLMMRYRKIRPQHGYGVCRAPVVSRLGLAGSLGWVR